MTDSAASPVAASASAPRAPTCNEWKTALSNAIHQQALGQQAMDELLHVALRASENGDTPGLDNDVNRYLPHDCWGWDTTGQAQSDHVL